MPVLVIYTFQKEQYSLHIPILIQSCHMKSCTLKGMRGLLDPAMRLDSVWEEFQRNKKKEEEAKKTKEQEGDKKVVLDKDGKPVVTVPLSGDIFDINTNLEELMKSLGVVTSAARNEQARLRGETGDSPPLPLPLPPSLSTRNINLCTLIL